MATTAGSAECRVSSVVSTARLIGQMLTLRARQCQTNYRLHFARSPFNRSTVRPSAR